MRAKRYKVPPEEAEAAYHCTSRTVNGEFLFDDAAKEMMRRLLWRTAEFCGLKIITYQLMTNHFHVLFTVPKKEPISDAELLRRYRVLNPRPDLRRELRIATIEAWLKANGSEAALWRARMNRLMGDVSAFMKVFKQRYSTWFNRTHERYGPLWSDRFTSVLCQMASSALQAMALYVDLNCVRAGLVKDPKDYRFGGYAEALAGNEKIRAGITCVFGGSTWKETQALYRQLLFVRGSAPRADAALIPAEAARNVMAERGVLSLAELLFCRTRFFSQGLVLGGRTFVQTYAAGRPAHSPEIKKTAPPVDVGWQDLAVLRPPRP